MCLRMRFRCVSKTARCGHTTCGPLILILKTDLLVLKHQRWKDGLVVRLRKRLWLFPRRISSQALSVATLP
jgi:hypothetical protein